MLDDSPVYDPEILEHFEVGELGIDLDPNLVCRVPVSDGGVGTTTCDEIVCTIEREDTLRVLAATATAHYREVHDG